MEGEIEDSSFDFPSVGKGCYKLQSTTKLEMKWQKNIPIKDTEELQNSFFPPAMPSCGVLNSKCMNTTIMAPYSQAAMTDTIPSDYIYLRKESINSDKVLVIVLMLQASK